MTKILRVELVIASSSYDKNALLVTKEVKGRISKICRRMQPRKIIPSLPDVVLFRIFSCLTYKDLCLAEVVCRRWQNLIYGKFKKECNELVVEQMGCRQIEAALNVALERLTISCPFNADEFLSGVMRRHHGWLKRLTCDVSFLARGVGKLKLKKDSRKKYFTGVHTLWIFMLQCDDELLADFSAIEEMLFLDLKQVTLQIHVENAVPNADKLLKILKNRSPELTVSLELQAVNANKIIQQLACLNDICLKSLKIICIELDHAPLKLNEISAICEERNITYDWIGFRDWYIHASPFDPLARHHVDTFRISSCKIANVDNLIACLGVNQRQVNLRKVVDKREKENIEAAEKALTSNKPFQKVLGFGVKKVKKSELIPEEFRTDEAKAEPKVYPLRRLELAGLVEFCDFFCDDYNLAKKEFEYRAKNQVENLELDISSLYFYH